MKLIKLISALFIILGLIQQWSFAAEKHTTPLTSVDHDPADSKAGSGTPSLVSFHASLMELADLQEEISLTLGTIAQEEDKMDAERKLAEESLPSSKGLPVIWKKGDKSYVDLLKGAKGPIIADYLSNSPEALMQIALFPSCRPVVCPYFCPLNDHPIFVRAFSSEVEFDLFGKMVPARSIGERILNSINKAKKSILLVYDQINYDPLIKEVRRLKGGNSTLDVRIIYGQRAPGKAEDLKAGGITVNQGALPTAESDSGKPLKGKMHCKYVIIDGKVVLCGSPNATRPGYGNPLDPLSRNTESGLEIWNPFIAGIFHSYANLIDGKDDDDQKKAAAALRGQLAELEKIRSPFRVYFGRVQDIKRDTTAPITSIGEAMIAMIGKATPRSNIYINMFLLGDDAMPVIAEVRNAASIPKRCHLTLKFERGMLHSYTEEEPARYFMIKGLDVLKAIPPRNREIYKVSFEAEAVPAKVPAGSLSASHGSTERKSATGGKHPKKSGAKDEPKHCFHDKILFICGEDPKLPKPEEFQCMSIASSGLTKSVVGMDINWEHFIYAENRSDFCPYADMAWLIHEHISRIKKSERIPYCEPYLFELDPDYRTDPPVKRRKAERKSKATGGSKGAAKQESAKKPGKAEKRKASGRGRGRATKSAASAAQARKNAGAPAKKA